MFQKMNISSQIIQEPSGCSNFGLLEPGQRIILTKMRECQDPKSLKKQKWNSTW